MPARKLSEAEIKTLLSKAKGWSLVNGKLHREVACKDFVTAFGNMTCVALVARSDETIIRNGSTCGTKWSST